VTIDAQRVDFIAVPTQDRDRAEQFYAETLGLRKNPNSTEKWIEFETGNVTLALVTPTEIGLPFEPLPFAAVVLRVDDVGEARRPPRSRRSRVQRRDVRLGRLQRRRLQGP
jgi:catechol 2,3-dioxygenase-like lactoylglutathione lyase family enzyme